MFTSCLSSQQVMLYSSTRQVKKKKKEKYKFWVIFGKNRKKKKKWSNTFPCFLCTVNNNSCHWLMDEYIQLFTKPTCYDYNISSIPFFLHYISWVNNSLGNCLSVTRLQIFFRLLKNSKQTGKLSQMYEWLENACVQS